MKPRAQTLLLVALALTVGGTSLCYSPISEPSLARSAGQR